MMIIAMRKRLDIKNIDLRLIHFFRKWHIPLARGSIFLVYFWFGIIKILGLSPASPLAQALVEKTVGVQYYHPLFITLAIFECLIGIMFLFPKATRVVIPLLLLHMVLVCSPLILLPDRSWQSFLVPTLEGQYIIKNAVIIALAIGLAASTKPMTKKSKRYT